MDRQEYRQRAYEFAHRTPKKLTVDQVRDIRFRASMGVSQKLMAHQYGVHKNTINRVVNYWSWTK